MNPPAFLQGGSILTGILYATVLYGMVAGGIWIVRQELDKKKCWFIEKNTNSGLVKVFRAIPGSEGLRTKVGKDDLFVKLKDSYSFGRSTRGDVFIYDSDTGQVQRPLPGSEGLWEGLDGKTWASFLKSGVNQLIAQSAGGGLFQTLLIAGVAIGGVILLVVSFIALKMAGALH